MLRMICIDDEPLALQQLKDALFETAIPIKSEFFGSVSKALTAHECDPADLVLSDLRMGTITGLEAISKMRVFAPQTIYMLLSGTPDLQSALRAVNEGGIFRFFTKPAAPLDLRQGLLEAIAEANLMNMRAVANAALSTAERIDKAIIFVNPNGKVIFANSPGRTLLEDETVFRIGSENELRSLQPSITKSFQEFLGKLSSNSESSAMKSLFRFSRSDNQPPVIVSAMFIPANQEFEAHYSLVLSDTAKKDFSNGAQLAIALNLTPSEARVVHGLVVGGSVEGAASMAGVSISTARTYLKNVFQKTGVSRQAELVRLAMLSAA